MATATCPVVVDVPVVVSANGLLAEPIQTRLARIIDEARSVTNLVRVQLAEYFSDEKNEYWNDCTAKEAGHKITRAVRSLDELANEGTTDETNDDDDDSGTDTDSDRDSDTFGTIHIVKDDNSDSDDSSDDDDDDENPGTDSDLSTQQSYDHTFYFLGIPICYSSRRVRRS